LTGQVEELKKKVQDKEEEVKKYKELWITEEKIKEEISNQLKIEKATRMSAENKLSDLDERVIQLDEANKFLDLKVAELNAEKLRAMKVEHVRVDYPSEKDILGKKKNYRSINDAMEEKEEKKCCTIS